MLNLKKLYLMEEKLNKIQCWNCKVEFSYSGEKYQDVICPNQSCEILNSIYPHPETIKCSWCEAEVKINDEACPKCGSKVTKEGLDKAVESNPGVVC